MGYYRGALVIAQTLWIAPVAIQLALLQRVSTLWEEGMTDKIQDRASQASRYAILITLLMVIGMAALAPDFVPVYLGADFNPAVRPVMILLPGVLGFAAARPTLAINQGRRNLSVLIAATGTTAIFNIILNLVLIPPYGMTGAAIATSISYFSLAVTQRYAARRLGYDPFRNVPILRIAVTGVVAAVPIFGLAWSINSSILSLVVVAPIGLIVFSLVAILTGVVPTTEVDLLRAELEQRSPL